MTNKLKYSLCVLFAVIGIMADAILIRRYGYDGNGLVVNVVSGLAILFVFAGRHYKKLYQKENENSILSL